MKFNRLSLITFLVGLLVGAAIFWGILSFIIPSIVKSKGATLSVSETDNLPLIQSSFTVAKAIYDGDYEELSGFVNPDGSLLVVPYSYVDASETSENQSFTQSQVKDFGSDKKPYLWGTNPNEQPISLTPSDFFKQFLMTQTRDFTFAYNIGVNRVIKNRESALENVEEVFPSPKWKYVDLSFPNSNSEAVDWISLKLVFEVHGTDKLYLSAIIHSAEAQQ